MYGLGTIVGYPTDKGSADHDQVARGAPQVTFCPPPGLAVGVGLYQKSVGLDVNCDSVRTNHVVERPLVGGEPRDGGHS